MSTEDVVARVKQYLGQGLHVPSTAVADLLAEVETLRGLVGSGYALAQAHDAIFWNARFVALRDAVREETDTLRARGGHSDIVTRLMFALAEDAGEGVGPQPERTVMPSGTAERDTASEFVPVAPPSPVPFTEADRWFHDELARYFSDWQRAPGDAARAVLREQEGR